MRLPLCLAGLAALLSVSATAQELFEEPDFNATEALVDLGIDITKLPAELTEESSAKFTSRSFDACRIAVRVPIT